VLWDQATGRLARLYALSERRDAVRLAGTLGVAAARKLEIPRKTIATWVSRDVT